MTIRRPRVFAAGGALIALAVAVAFMSVTRTVTTIEPPPAPAASHEAGDKPGDQPPDFTVSFGTEVTEEAIHFRLGIPLILAFGGVALLASGITGRPSR